MSEYDPHSFIVKVWIEETTEEAGRATWRGHITHVPGGERRYIDSLDDIIAFVSHYLRGMGVKFGFRARVSHWLKPGKQRPKS